MFGFRKSDETAKLAALELSQAIIKFETDGTIITANENFLGAMGYTLAEVQAQHHRMFVEAEYTASAEYQAFWDSLARGEYQSAEYKRLGKGGTEVWIQASYNPIIDAQGRAGPTKLSNSRPILPRES